MSDKLADLWAEFKAAVIAEKGRRGAADMLDFCAGVLRGEAEIAIHGVEPTCRRCVHFAGDRTTSRAGACHAQFPLKAVADGRDIWPKTEPGALACHLYQPARPRALSDEDAA